MDPERRESHTYIERERRSGGGTAMGFIVGGLVVAVAIIAAVFWGADFGDPAVEGPDVEISTQDEIQAVVPAAPEQDEVEVEVETAPSPAAPADQAAPADPAAPAQN